MARRRAVLVAHEFSDVMSADGSSKLLDALAENYGELIGYLARRLGGRAEADDAFQDTYLRMRRVSDEAEILNPRAYVFRIAENVAVDHLRNRAVRNRFVASGDLPDVAADVVSAEREIDYRERLGKLRAVVKALPARQQQVFLMHKFDGLSYAEIATRLGISRSGVEKLMIKALSACRRDMGDFLD